MKIIEPASWHTTEVAFSVCQLAGTQIQEWLPASWQTTDMAFLFASWLAHRFKSGCPQAGRPLTLLFCLPAGRHTDSRLAASKLADL